MDLNAAYLNIFSSLRAFIVYHYIPYQLAAADLTLRVGDDVIEPATEVRDLDLDAELTIKQHISSVVSNLAASFS